MEKNLKRKMFMGFKGVMLPLPLMLSSQGMKRGVKSARANAARLSDEERRVHHFVVVTMANAKKPITIELIAKELNMTTDRVLEIIDKLEALKTFLYRSDGIGINWAYPISLENTGSRITASTGEQFYAA